MTKPHGNTGKQNALKGHKPLSVRYPILMTPGLDTKARTDAKARGMLFSDHIRDLLKEYRRENA